MGATCVLPSVASLTGRAVFLIWASLVRGQLYKIINRAHSTGFQHRIMTLKIFVEVVDNFGKSDDDLI